MIRFITCDDNKEALDKTVNAIRKIMKGKNNESKSKL